MKKLTIMTNREAKDGRQIYRGEPDLLWRDLWTSPVVEIVVKVPISNSKLELLQKLLVLHHIQCIEHIKPQLVRGREGGGC